MPKQKIAPAFVLVALAAGLAAGPAPAQTSPTPPPPPGPYQGAPEFPTMPVGQLQTPQAPAKPSDPGAQPQSGLSQQPTATQIWGQPPVMQVPYWMQAPGSGQNPYRPGGVSPDAGPDPRGGGQAEQTQLSPAGQATAPSGFSGGNFAPGYAPGFGSGLTPGSFPGYFVAPNRNGQSQAQGGQQAGMSAGGSAQAAGRARNFGQGQGTGPAFGQPGGYGYPVYPGYPAYMPPAYMPYGAQVPVPYWGAPVSAVPYGYGYGAPGPVNPAGSAGAAPQATGNGQP